MPARQQAFEQQIAQCVGGQPAVAAQRDRFFAGLMEQGRIGAAQIDHEIVVEIVLDHAADIVLTKYLWVHSRAIVAAAMRRINRASAR